MNAYGFIAVGFGAALGAWLRWGLSAWMNPMTASLPMGTLAANLIGGYLVGIAVEYFLNGFPTEIQLFVITGFLGGLTTFSTFSAETVALFSRSQFGWGIVLIVLHVAGSLAMTALGVWTVRLLR